ncbi:hypothetical protein DB41_GR00040 [Neochlamydia sp. TUME1]|nr:hypothetical protein DB41_GR00040 [Neochlamydia sp. TUME1]
MDLKSNKILFQIILLIKVLEKVVEKKLWRYNFSFSTINFDQFLFLIEKRKS